jgi:hypothetical protein
MSDQAARQDTAVSIVNLKVPKLRRHSFETAIIERNCRRATGRARWSAFICALRWLLRYCVGRDECFLSSSSSPHPC